MTASAGPAPRTAWPQVLIVTFAGAAVALQIGKASITLTQISAEFSLGVVEAAAYISCISLFAALTGWAFGWFAGKLGIRATATLGLAIMGAASLLGAAATGFAWLMAVRLAEAFALLMVVAAGPAILREATRPGDEALPFGLWAMWMPIGLAAAMLLGRYGLEEWGWRGLHLLCATPPLLAAGLMALLVLNRPPVRHIAPVAQGDGRSVLGSPEVVRMAVCFGLFSVVYITFAGFVPTVAIETLGMTSAGAAVLGFWTSVLIIPGNLAGVVGGRFGWTRRRLLVASFALMSATGALFFMPAAADGLRIAGGLVFAFAAGIAPGVFWSSIPRLADTTGLPAARVSALFFQISATGQVAGPVAAGAMVQATGDWTGASAVVVASGIVGLVLCSVSPGNTRDNREADERS